MAKKARATRAKTGNLFPDEDRESLRKRTKVEPEVVEEISKVTGGAPPANRKLRVGDLRIDYRVQRHVTNAKVIDKAKRFDLSAVGVLHVSKRKDGHHYIIDGHLRTRCFLFHNMDNYNVRCLVYEDLTIDQEAKLFRLLNDNRKCSAIDDFRVSIVQKDTESLAIRRIAKAFGFNIAHGGKDGRIDCIATLRNVFRSDGGHGGALKFALEVISEAWGDSREGLGGIIISGLALIYEHVDDSSYIDTGSMSKKLAATQGGPSALIGRAKDTRAFGGGNLDRNLAAAVIGIYNKGRRAKKIRGLD